MFHFIKSNIINQHHILLGWCYTVQLLAMLPSTGNQVRLRAYDLKCPDRNALPILNGKVPKQHCKKKKLSGKIAQICTNHRLSSALFSWEPLHSPLINVHSFSILPICLGAVWLYRFCALFQVWTRGILALHYLICREATHPINGENTSHMTTILPCIPHRYSGHETCLNLKCVRCNAYYSVYIYLQYI